MSVPNHKKSSNGHAPKAIKAPKRRAAFYDLDGTLVDLNLVHAAIFTLANVGEWSGRVSYLLGFAARIPRLYVAEQRDRRLLNTVLFEAFKGVSRDRLFSLGEEYCERILIESSFSARGGIDRGESRGRDRAGAGHGIARLHRRAARASSRHRGLRRQPICLQPRPRDRPAGRTGDGGRREGGLVRGLCGVARSRPRRIAGVTPTRITTPRFSPRSGIPSR